MIQNYLSAFQSLFRCYIRFIMRINKSTIYSKQATPQRLSLSMLFQQYCQNNQRLFTLVVRDSTICLKECQSNVFSQGSNYKPSNKIESQPPQKQEGNFFHDVVSKIYTNPRLSGEDLAKTKVNVIWNYNQLNNGAVPSHDYLSPMPKNNYPQAAQFKKMLSPQYEKKQHINTDMGDHIYLKVPEQTKTSQNNKMGKVSTQNKNNQQPTNQKQKNSYVGCTSYRIINKIYPNNNNNNHNHNNNNQNQNQPSPNNKNQSTINPLDSSIRSQHCNELKRVKSQVLKHTNYEIDFSFQNINKFMTNVSSITKMGDNVPMIENERASSSATRNRDDQLLTAQLLSSRISQKKEQQQNHKQLPNIPSQTTVATNPSNQQKYKKGLVESLVLFENNQKQKQLLDLFDSLNDSPRKSRIFHKMVSDNNPQVIKNKQLVNQQFRDRNNAYRAQLEQIDNDFQDQILQQKNSSYCDSQICIVDSIRVDCNRCCW